MPVFKTFQQFQAAHPNESFDNYIIEFIRTEKSPKKYLYESVDTDSVGIISRIFNDIGSITTETNKELAESCIAAIEKHQLEEWYLQKLKFVIDKLLNPDFTFKDNILDAFLGGKYTTRDALKKALYGDPRDEDRVKLFADNIFGTIGIAISSLIADVIAKEDRFKKYNYIVFGADINATDPVTLTESLPEMNRKFNSAFYYEQTHPEEYLEKYKRQLEKYRNKLDEVLAKLEGTKDKAKADTKEFLDFTITILTSIQQSIERDLSKEKLPSNCVEVTKLSLQNTLRAEFEKLAELTDINERNALGKILETIQKELDDPNTVVRAHIFADAFHEKIKFLERLLTKGDKNLIVVIRSKELQETSDKILPLIYFMKKIKSTYLQEAIAIYCQQLDQLLRRELKQAFHEKSIPDEYLKKIDDVSNKFYGHLLFKESNDEMLRLLETYKKDLAAIFKEIKDTYLPNLPLSQSVPNPLSFLPK